jgi:hypothetical protein
VLDCRAIDDDDDDDDDDGKINYCYNMYCKRRNIIIVMRRT